MARPRNSQESEPAAESDPRPQDDPDYKDAGQLYVEEHDLNQPLPAAEEADDE